MQFIYVNFYLLNLILKFKTHQVKTIKLILALLLILLLTDCNSKNGIQNQFKQGAQNIETHYISDKTLAVFQVSLDKNAGQWELSGETNHLIAHQKIIGFSDSLLGKDAYTNYFSALPDSALGDSTYGIINVSVTPIREESRHASQMVDQAVMGFSVRLLKRVDSWFLAQTHYDYIGWIHHTAIHRCDSTFSVNWQSAAIHQIRELNTHIYFKPNIESMPVTDMVLNNRISVIKLMAKWSKVMLPDGRVGFVLNEQIEPYSNRKSNQNRLNLLLDKAHRMMGTPYLWGGNSSKGNDCSGFTQIVYKSVGKQLPRDARQQALEGLEIIPNETWSNVKAGDLLFFGNGKKVTHAGISIGGKDFIHQGGKVAINSLNPESDVYSPYRAKSFMLIKRMID